MGLKGCTELNRWYATKPQTESLFGGIAYLIRKLITWWRPLLTQNPIYFKLHESV